MHAPGHLRFVQLRARQLGLNVTARLESGVYRFRLAIRHGRSVFDSDALDDIDAMLDQIGRA